MLADRTKILARETDIMLSRRRFLLATMATSAGLAVGFRPFAAASEEHGGQAAIPNPFQAYVEVAENGAVTILSSQFDMGQGSYHGIATLVVEELGCDWSDVSVTGAAGNTNLYGNLVWGGAMQGTGGSSSMVSSWERYRKAGAAARQLLVEAAAKAWGVPGGEIEVRKGQLAHGSSGRTAGFGEFAKAAGALPAPSDIKLKPRGEWSEIGNAELRRYDSRSKTNGPAC
jgi:isoquinoline 1-oxidoreductase beta subunit